MSSEGRHPQSIEVDIEGVGEVLVRVEYPWGTQVCPICKAPGHLAKDCKEGKHTWIPVGKVNTATMANKSETSKVPVATAPTREGSQQEAQKEVDDSSVGASAQQAGGSPFNKDVASFRECFIADKE